MENVGGMEMGKTEESNNTHHNYPSADTEGPNRAYTGMASKGLTFKVYCTARQSVAALPTLSICS